MSDSPQGPDWWRATDGRWYPPEQFTGPPELRPGARPGVAPTSEPTSQAGEPRASAASTAVADDAAGDQSGAAPPRQRPSRGLILVVVAVVALVAAAALGVGILRGGDDDGGDAAEASPGSTSTGPVRVDGTFTIASSTPLGTPAPTTCEDWATLVRVEIQDESGAALTNFAPTAESGGPADRAEDGTTTIDCTMQYRADVPAAGSYSLALIDVRGGGRAMVVETVEGADEGDVAGPEVALVYACGDGGTSCTFQRG